jgi:sterol desaturase/sphingolipid hydroxylase (fatty acid hydroxylase superfamily)
MVLDWFLAHESGVRLGAFLGLFAVMAIWEVARPRRRLLLPKARRWLSNLSLVAVNSLLLRLVFPAAAVGIAAAAAARGWGLFAQLSLPLWAEILLSVVLLDLVVYLQHRAFHAVPVFWRLHRVHHADRDFDLTTGTRFHPVEMLLSMCIKGGAVVLLGAPAVAVMLFELILNLMAVFNHGNVTLPTKVDAVVRRLLVTPDMHRVHHSTLPDEHNSNYGFNLSLWDRLLRTYRAQPSLGQEGMSIGLPSQGPPDLQTLPWMLLMPFRRGSATS